MNEYLVALIVMLFLVLRFLVPLAIVISIGYVFGRLEDRFFFPATG